MNETSSKGCKHLTRCCTNKRPNLGSQKGEGLISLMLVAICALVTILSIFPESIIILCDSNNHHTRTHNNKGQQGKQYINREDVYFQISEPENLRYTFKARSSRIGVPFTETFTNIALVLAEPRDACTSTINKLELRDNIALVERGGCSFLEKCIEIERSGGIGLLVYDYDKHNDENYIEMIDDNTSRNCSISAVSLLGKDGHMIVQALLALRLSRAVITIPASVNTTVDKVPNPPWLIW